jgi:hypothetical protein
MAITVATCAIDSTRMTPGDDGIPGKVTRLVPLRSGERVLTHRAHAGVELGDAVDEKERIAVRDERFDRGLVERRHLRGSLRTRARASAAVATC